MPAEELGPRLAGLVRRELLQREMDARSPERGQYAFVQALIREVAYNTLSRRDRKKLHLAAARYFEALGTDEIAGVLASHYLAAHANAAEGQEADALAGQARIALKAAATRAASLGGQEQAASFLEQALTVTTDPAERADILDEAALAARLASRWAHAEDLARRAVDSRRELGDRPATAKSIAQLAFLLGSQYKNEESHELLENSLAEFADLDDDPALAEMKVILARWMVFDNQYETAIEILESVLEQAERKDQIAIVARALGIKANALVGRGRRREGIGLARLVKELASENGLTDTMLRASVNLGNFLSDLDLAAALATYREALAVARRVGYRESVLQIIGNVGYAGFLSGDWDASLADMEDLMTQDLEPRDSLFLMNNILVTRAARGESIDDGLMQMERIGSGLSETAARFFLPDATANRAMARGDLDGAVDGFMEIVEADASQAPEYLYRAARPMMWAGDLGRAQEYARQAEVAGGFGPLVAARKATMHAGIAALEGKPVEAVALYREALKGWRATHAVWDEALTGVDMATLLDPAEPEVAAAIKSTREILERLGAAPYLARLAAAAVREHAPAPAVRKNARAAAAVAD